MEKKEKIQALQDIVRINSVNGNEEEVARYIQKLLAKYDIEATLVPYASGRSSLVAEITNGSGQVLGLTGHMDVVDAGDESQWLYPPFEAKIVEDKLYGRGSTDMKSGLMAMVIAMIELKEQDLPFNGKVRLLATVGEEVGELGAEDLTQKNYADDLDGLIIGEPSNYNLCYAHMGSINYQVTSIGKEAHSSMPENGVNAINHLNTFITKVNQEMQKISDKYEDQELGRTIHNVTTIHGGEQVNSIPGKAHLQGNIRTIPAFGNEQVIKTLQALVDELNQKATYQLELKIDYNKIPVKADKNSKLIQVIQKQFNKPLPLFGMAGTTDAAEFVKAKKPFDFVVFGPGEPLTAHAVNEYVTIDNYLDMIEKYIAITKEYLQ